MVYLYLVLKSFFISWYFLKKGATLKLVQDSVFCIAQMQHLEVSRPVPQLKKIRVGNGIEWASLVKLIGKFLLYLSRQRIRAGRQGIQKTYAALRE